MKNEETLRHDQCGNVRDRAGLIVVLEYEANAASPKAALCVNNHRIYTLVKVPFSTPDVTYKIGAQALIVRVRNPKRKDDVFVLLV